MLIKVVLSLLIFVIISCLIILKRRNKAPFHKYIPKKFYYQKSLIELTKIITSTDEIHDLLCLLIDNLSKILRVDIASFLILAPDSNKYLISEAIGLGIEKYKDAINEDIHFLFNHLKKQKEIISVDKLKRKRKLNPNEKKLLVLLINMELNSVFPLIHKGKIIGAFNLGPKINNQPFDIDEFDLLTIILNYTQVAIVNSQLYSHFENTTRNLELSKIALLELSENLTEERNILSQRIKEKNKKLETIRSTLNLREKLLKEILSVVSHELKSPLASIKTFIELMQIKKNLSIKQRNKYLETMNEETDRLTRLINNLLDISRIESGKMDWEVENHEIKPLISRSIQIVKPQAKKRNINISTKLTKNLGIIPVDYDRLIQVMTNLLTNAIKFSPNNEIITVEASKNGTKDILVKVRDKGPGIPKEEEKAIFDKFVSFSHKKGKTKGSGLGLTICRDIIEFHKGRIWVEKNKPKGASFCFSLPQFNNKLIKGT